jgi:3-hydroxyisobutyrate dehydrogenase
MVSARLKKLTSNTFGQPTWELNMARKDARLMIEQARKGNVKLMVIPAIASQMDQMIEQGHGHDDWTVIGKGSI